ncbi:MAG TPA: hypothetical protein VFT79_05290 [Solirubrobacterales bacterium]|nr:hypothetical protein [Solirubrobacterales bacterium]
MSDPFHDRIREATVVPTEERVELLGQASKAAATSLGSGDALDLVRVVCRRPVSDEVKDRVRARLNSKAEVVLEHRHDQLMATLAAVALIRVFARPTFVHGLLPALAIRAARTQGWAPIHPDVFTHADYYIRERALVMRRPVAADDFKQSPKEGEEVSPIGEVKAIRAALLRDGKLRKESEQLLWWVSSAELPRSSTDAAIEFKSLLGFNPEPGGTEELFRAKFRDGDSRSRSTWIFSRVGVPAELQDFCPTVARDSGPGTPDVKSAMASLNELFLIDALKERPLEQ